jgi:hypothetical protein
VRLDSNDYSVHPGVIGRRVEVVADLERVRVLCDGRTVADHERIWARHQALSAAEHVTAARTLRAERLGLLRPATATGRPPGRSIRCGAPPRAPPPVPTAGRAARPTPRSTLVTGSPGSCSSTRSLSAGIRGSSTVSASSTALSASSLPEPLLTSPPSRSNTAPPRTARTLPALDAGPVTLRRPSRPTSNTAAVAALDPSLTRERAPDDRVS